MLGKFKTFTTTTLQDRLKLRCLCLAGIDEITKNSERFDKRDFGIDLTVIPQATPRKVHDTLIIELGYKAVEQVVHEDITTVITKYVNPKDSGVFPDLYLGFDYYTTELQLTGTESSDVFEPLSSFEEYQKDINKGIILIELII